VSTKSTMPVDSLAVAREQVAGGEKQSIATHRWGMAIDTSRCTGCKVCQVACKTENRTPPGVNYMPVIEQHHGGYPYAAATYLPRPCMHCDRAPCEQVCPVEATFTQRDGAVVVDYMKCIGCRYCLTSCPYGARQFDFNTSYQGEGPRRPAFETVPSPEHGHLWPRESHVSPADNARSCHFCSHRLAQGVLPACVESCPTAAIIVGDINDPMSEVSRLIHSHESHRLREELGTEPKVWYLK